MSKLISTIRHHFRVRHEHKLLELAMRNAPLPAPSEGLKQRLLADAAAASRLSHVQVKSPNLLWIAPAAVLAVALIGVVWSVNSHRDDRVSPARVAQKPADVRSETSLVRPTVQHEMKQGTSAVRLAGVVSTAKGHSKLHQYPAKPNLQPQKVERVVALRQIASIPRYAPLPAQNTPTDQYVVEKRLAEPNSIRSMSTVDDRRSYTISQMGTAMDIPSINVSIGYAADDEIGYAYASAWSNEDGHRVKTEWTLVDDPYAQQTQEEMSISGSSPTQSIAVTVVTPLRRDE